MRRLRFVAAALAAALVSILAGCGDDDGPADTLRLGYLPNVTHATALVGIEDGHLQRALEDVRLVPQVFNAGPAVIEALFSGALDAAYVGPSPAVNGFVQSKGEALRVVAGAAGGGAALVVQPGIAGPADLRGRRIASPQLGNTQDVALRHWLQQQGLRTSRDGDGDVMILPQTNPQILDKFAAGSLDGAWVPEPWVARLVAVGGKVLVDERSLWPDGAFATTQLVVRKDYLDRNPEVVRRRVAGGVASNAALVAAPAAARRSVGSSIRTTTNRSLPPEVVEAAWSSLRFTDDPLSSSQQTAAEHAQKLGLLPAASLAGLYDLRALNGLRRAQGQTPIPVPAGGAG